MNQQEIYGLLDLYYDKRFTVDEKLSVYMSNYEHITEIGIMKDVYVVIVAGIIMEILQKKQMRKSK